MRGSPTDRRYPATMFVTGEVATEGWWPRGAPVGLVLTWSQWPARRPSVTVSQQQVLRRAQVRGGWGFGGKAIQTRHGTQITQAGVQTCRHAAVDDAIDKRCRAVRRAGV